MTRPDYEIKAIGRQRAAMSMYAENDGRFPDDAAVLVRFPLKDEQDRESWEWLPGSILGQCHGNTGEWHVIVDGRGDLAEPDPDNPGEWLYPVCFRTAEELRLISDKEWAEQAVPAPKEA